MALFVKDSEILSILEEELILDNNVDTDIESDSDEEVNNCSPEVGSRLGEFLNPELFDIETVNQADDIQTKTFHISQPSTSSAIEKCSSKFDEIFEQEIEHQSGLEINFISSDTAQCSSTPPICDTNIPCVAMKKK